MAELDGDTVDSNGLKPTVDEEEPTLYLVLKSLISSILVQDPESSSTLVERIKVSFSSNAPLLREASKNTGNDILKWSRGGSSLRALLVVSVGTVTLLSLTGLLVFMLFFVAATLNAIVISLIMSLAAAGGFLAIFFACLTAVYVGALSVAFFIISTTTISAIIAALIATGWIAFFWTVWIVTKKSVGFASHSVSLMGSALSTYSHARHYRND